MNIYILDPDFNKIGLCDSYKSFIWTPRYFECGDFELYTPATAELLQQLTRGNLVMREDDTEHAMFIERVVVTTDAEEGNTITASGRCLKSVLTRRIIPEQTVLTGTVAQGISRLLAENLINPNVSARKVDNFILGSFTAGTESMTKQFTGDNLADAVIEICRGYGLGWDVRVNLSTKKMLFDLYAGTDRSYTQSLNPFVVFSPEYENLVNTTYEENDAEYKNVAIVGGEGEGTARRFVTTGDLDAAGLDRYELFVDSRGTSSNDGEITPEEYDAMLAANGRDSLAECETTVTFEGSTQTGRNYQYGVDYNLGDIVEVVNEYGIESRSRISEIIDCIDETGRHTIPTFESVYTPREYWVDESGAYYIDETGRKYTLH